MSNFYQKKVVLNGERFLEVGDSETGKKILKPLMPEGCSWINNGLKPLTKQQLRALRKIREALEVYE